MPQALTIPAKIKLAFEITSPNTTIESQWYPPYTSLLTWLFPFDEDYHVGPQFPPPQARREAIDFTVIYIVKRKTIPVFFIEIKPGGHIRHDGQREDADMQMRARFTSLRQDIELPKMYGVSAIGTRFLIYTFMLPDFIDPPQLVRSGNRHTDTAPISRWNFDLLERRGEERFLELAEEIKLMSEDLREIKEGRNDEPV